MNLQMRLFDGYPVDLFAARFGTYDLADEDVEAFRDGDVLVVVMVASVEGATIKPTAAGDRKRVNNLRIHNMRVAKGDMRTELVEIFHLAEHDDQLPLGLDLPTTLRRDVDTETGEIPQSPLIAEIQDAQHVLNAPTSERPPTAEPPWDEEFDEDEDGQHVLKGSGDQLEATPAAEPAFVGAAARDKALAAFLDE